MENCKNKNNKTPTYIYALGGLEEIGKNTYVVEHGNDLVLVDAGIKFANDLLLGFDGLIANYSVLIEKQDKIKALIITHGHEDHIGGIVHILKKVKIPKIIAPVLSTKLIEKKLNEHKNIFKPEIIPYLDDDEFKFGEIEVDFFRVCHSIPDSFAVAFKTPNGNIVETGDFRFDFATSSDQTNLFKLMQIASRGIDLLLCESTSSEVPGFSESEKYIIKNIEDYIKEAKGRVFVSTFASNLSRIESIIAMGINLNRKVAILGKSMEANVKISRRLGYLKASDLDFIQAKDIVNFPDNEILVILTGSQGEENAALNVMASQKHSKISLKPTDTIILSSNPIPGNFAAVEQMTNNLYKLGVTVIENSPEKKIHASGHATRSEQQLMIQSIGAKYVMPIHGEYKMLKTLKKNTMDLGYAPENIIIAKNGDVVQLLDHEVTLTDIHHNATPMFINGHDINENSYDLLQERNTLSSDGIVRLLIVYSQNKKSIINVTLLTRGSFYAKDFSSLVHKITSTLKHEISKELNNGNFDFKNLEEIVIGIAKPMIWRWIKKNPIFVIDFQNFDNLEELSKNKDFFIKKQNTLQTINDLEENIDDGEYYGE